MFNIQAWGKSTYARIALNAFTFSFFVVTFIYCLISSIIHSNLYSIDLRYNGLTKQLVAIGSPSARIPHSGLSEYPCHTISPSNSTGNSDPVTQSTSVASMLALNDWKRGFNVTRATDSAQGTVARIQTLSSTKFDLNQQCLETLVFPSETIRNFQREDITSIVIQVWLLAVSVAALMNGSVPHMLAVLGARFLIASWATYVALRGPRYDGNWREIIAASGTPCSLDIFSDFWRQRHTYELLNLVFSIIALVAFSYISFKLLKLYNSESFNVVGAPEEIMRINKFFMALLACLQLEAFVLVTSISLWIDVLFTTAMSHLALHMTLYESLFIVTCVLLLPWIAMGWYATRREMKKLMIVFLAIGFIFISGWAIMFYSIVYRWSFVQFPFLATFTLASFALLFASMALGILCRLNFGKGLAEYLRAEEALASSNFTQDSFDTKSITSLVHKEKKTKEPETLPIPSYRWSMPYDGTNSSTSKA